MAYLIQRTFTNDFKDFKLSQAEFYSDLSSITPDDYFEVNEKCYNLTDFNDKAAEEIKKLLESTGLSVQIKEETSYDDEETPYKVMTVYAAYMKAWELVEGHRITEKHAVGYYWFNDTWNIAKTSKREIEQMTDEAMEALDDSGLND